MFFCTCCCMGSMVFLSAMTLLNSDDEHYLGAPSSAHAVVEECRHCLLGFVKRNHFYKEGFAWLPCWSRSVRAHAARTFGAGRFLTRRWWQPANEKLNVTLPWMNLSHIATYRPDAREVGAGGGWVLLCICNIQEGRKVLRCCACSTTAFRRIPGRRIRVLLLLVLPAVGRFVGAAIADEFGANPGCCRRRAGFTFPGAFPSACISFL